MTPLPTPSFLSSRPRARGLRGGLIAAAAALALLSPAAALASGTAVISDCSDHGRLTKKYAAADYAYALKHIPADLDEYTDCRNIIKRAQLGLGGPSSHAGSGGGGGVGGGTGSSGTPSGGSGSGAAPGGASGGGNTLNAYANTIAGASPQERASVRKLATSSPAAVQIGGRALRADSLGHGDLGSLNTLPTPFVLVLLLLGLGVLAAAVPTLRTFVRTRLQRPA